MGLSDPSVLGIPNFKLYDFRTQDTRRAGRCGKTPSKRVKTVTRRRPGGFTQRPKPAPGPLEKKVTYQKRKKKKEQNKTTNKGGGGEKREMWGGGGESNINNSKKKEGKRGLGTSEWWWKRPFHDGRRGGGRKLRRKLKTCVNERKKPEEHAPRRA